jgi:bifunctional DNase/RNase
VIVATVARQRSVPQRQTRKRPKQIRQKFKMTGPKEDFILMVVGGLTLDPNTKMPIVVLKDPDNKLNLPIWIGPLEAASMATEIEGIKPQRPMTHDLLRNVLGDLGATVEAVEITELKENTYFARIELRTREGAGVQIDSRPSDAISIALRTKSPIYVAKQVLESSSELHEAAEQGSVTDQNLAGVSRDKWAEIREKMSPEDFKYKM